jgi:hypothetical protein
LLFAAIGRQKASGHAYSPRLKIQWDRRCGAYPEGPPAHRWRRSKHTDKSLKRKVDVVRRVPPNGSRRRASLDTWSSMVSIKIAINSLSVVTRSIAKATRGRQDQHVALPRVLRKPVVSSCRARASAPRLALQARDTSSASKPSAGQCVAHDNDGRQCTGRTIRGNEGAITEDGRAAVAGACPDRPPADPVGDGHQHRYVA